MLMVIFDQRMKVRMDDNVDDGEYESALTDEDFWLAFGLVSCWFCDNCYNEFIVDAAQN